MRQHQKQLKPGFKENNPYDRRTIEALKSKILGEWSNPKKKRP
ncbi:MAG: hypothetical protein ACFHWX_18735 [Bacteroidota bacterium]